MDSGGLSTAKIHFKPVPCLWVLGAGLQDQLELCAVAATAPKAYPKYASTRQSAWRLQELVYMEL
jgi:hypothetical protein